MNCYLEIWSRSSQAPRISQLHQQIPRTRLIAIIRTLQSLLVLSSLSLHHRALRGLTHINEMPQNLLWILDILFLYFVELIWRVWTFTSLEEKPYPDWPTFHFVDQLNLNGCREHLPLIKVTSDGVLRSLYLNLRPWYRYLRAITIVLFLKLAGSRDLCPEFFWEIICRLKGRAHSCFFFRCPSSQRSIICFENFCFSVNFRAQILLMICLLESIYSSALSDR